MQVNWSYFHPGRRSTANGFTSIACDGAHLYVHRGHGGLIKIGTGLCGSVRGLTYAIQSAFRYVFTFHWRVIIR